MAGEPGPVTEPLHSPDQATMALVDATDAVARHWRL
jgi:hypothetical protein